MCQSSFMIFFFIYFDVQLVKTDLMHFLTKKEPRIFFEVQEIKDLL